MANGHSGKHVDDRTKARAVELVRKGNTPDQVSKRLGVSKTAINKWVAQSSSQLKK